MDLNIELIWWEESKVDNVTDRIRICIVRSIEYACYVKVYIENYSRWLYMHRRIFNTSRTKSQNSNVSRLVLHLSLLDPLKPIVMSRMKMWLE